jgi:hypothetical protein
MAEPRVCVLVFDRASVGNFSTRIAALSQRLGPMGELVIASEEMDREVYGQAVKHGATFLYLDAGEALVHALRREIDRAAEWFIMEMRRSVFSAGPSTSTPDMPGPSPTAARPTG